MSWVTDARDTVENVGSTVAAPFTFGQSERLVSKSGQDSGLGHFAQFYNDMWRDADIAGLVAGGAYLAAPMLAGGEVAGGAGTPGATTALAAEAPAATNAEALSQGLIQGTEGAAAATPAATGAIAPSVAPAAVDSSMGMPFTPGPGSVGAMDPSNAGIFTQGADWIGAHPVASIIGANMAGGALKGYADLSAQRESDKRKAQAAQDLADLPRRQKQGNPSVGGAGVNLNLRPGSKVLLRPDGTPVYRPGTGILNGAMNGARG
jgi:hypothetical protein